MIDESAETFKPVELNFDYSNLSTLISKQVDLNYFRYLKVGHQRGSRLDILLDGSHTKFFNFSASFSLESYNSKYTLLFTDAKTSKYRKSVTSLLTHCELT
jgi:hypothetical protein